HIELVGASRRWASRRLAPTTVLFINKRRVKGVLTCARHGLSDGCHSRVTTRWCIWIIGDNASRQWRVIIGAAKPGYSLIRNGALFTVLNMDVEADIGSCPRRQVS